MIYRDSPHPILAVRLRLLGLICRRKAAVFLVLISILWVTHAQEVLELDDADKLEKDVLVVEQVFHLALHFFHLG